MWAEGKGRWRVSLFLKLPVMPIKNNGGVESQFEVNSMVPAYYFILGEQDTEYYSETSKVINKLWLSTPSVA